jgi:hypothetical protein
MALPHAFGDIIHAFTAAMIREHSRAAQVVARIARVLAWSGSEMSRQPVS